jgi:acetyl-CoA acetyltransferase family protein
VDRDETIRDSTTPEGLTKLKPSFQNEEFSARFPQINWSITAGNSSQISDGASAALMMSEETAERLGLQPLARIVSMAICGSDPILMLTGPIPVTEKLFSRSDVKLDEIGQVEVNEAFASVPVAWQREFGVPDAKLNPNGGAISLGHPLGASGTRLLACLLYGLQESGERYGLQVMCEGGGMANATLVENLQTSGTRS